MSMDEPQYNDISSEYKAIAEIDPSKQYVQYPEALRLLGDVNDLDVLDVGCGTGIFDKMLASHGARVVGYDSSSKQIEIAQSTASDPNVEYLVADPTSFRADHKFDKAISVMVLPYAKDSEELGQFFASTGDALNNSDNAQFSSIIFNPDYQRLGEEHYNRVFSRIGDGKIRVDFFGPDHKITMSATFSDFSKADYERAARAAGFELSWEALSIGEGGREALGSDFWQGYEEDCPYVGLVAKKV
jgi:toxoflavin synthase